MDRRLVAPLLLAVGFLLTVGSGAAQAHASYVRSDPAANARLATSPAQIVVGFSQKLLPAGSDLTLLATDGRSVAAGAAAGSDATELMLMPPALAPGVYAVAWQAQAAADNDTSKGYFAFGVGAAPTQSAPGTTFRASQGGVAFALTVAPFSAGENTYTAMVDDPGQPVTRIRLRLRPLDRDIGVAIHDIDPAAGLSNSGLELALSGRYHIIAEVRRKDVPDDLTFEFDGSVPASAGASATASPAASDMAMGAATPSAQPTAGASPARATASGTGGTAAWASVATLLIALLALFLIAPQTRIRSARGRVGVFLAERLGLAGLRYSVPAHANSLPYVLGGITLMGFIVLLATGVYLAQFYHPQPADAHDSVVYIITGAPFGDVVRSVHFWSAQVVVVTLLLHLLRVLFTGSFKRPRELNWFVGLGLFAITLAFVYTGTVLKLDQEAVEALAHNTAWAELAGGVGAWFSGDFSQSVPLLARVDVAHTSILPLLFFALIATHIFLIKQHGISPRVTRDAVSRATAGEGTSHFDAHLRRMAGYGLLLVAAALVLTLVIPAPLGLPGVAGAEVTRPPWMFVWLVPYEGKWGISALFLVPVVVGLALALVPILDRSPLMHPRRRFTIVLAAAVILLAVVASGVYAETQPITSHLEMGAGGRP